MHARQRKCERLLRIATHIFDFYIKKRDLLNLLVSQYSIVFYFVLFV